MNRQCIADYVDHEDDMVVYYYRLDEAEAHYRSFYGSEYANRRPPVVRISTIRPGMYYIRYPK